LKSNEIKAKNVQVRLECLAHVIFIVDMAFCHMHNQKSTQKQKHMHTHTLDTPLSSIRLLIE